MHAIQTLMEMAGSDPNYTYAAICTEGNEHDWENIISLGHLPLFEG
jgi:hypothetical protein